MKEIIGYMMAHVPVLDLEDPYNGHEYVDLGLPSGKLWSVEVFNVDLNLLEMPDIKDLLGGDWRLPTEEELLELIDNNVIVTGTVSTSTLNDVKPWFAKGSSNRQTQDVSGYNYYYYLNSSSNNYLEYRNYISSSLSHLTGIYLNLKLGSPQKFILAGIIG